ncbi:pogo transposable element with KRAB domain [Ditylenchus destructor]|nr:pogo transposable element with KRAB domain [Ditylenchus destructor]
MSVSQIISQIHVLIRGAKSKIYKKSNKTAKGGVYFDINREDIPQGSRDPYADEITLSDTDSENMPDLEQVSVKKIRIGSQIQSGYALTRTESNNIPLKSNNIPLESNIIPDDQSSLWGGHSLQIPMLCLLIQIRQFVNKYFSYGTIFAADETAVFLDPTYGKCIDQKGAKEAPDVSWNMPFKQHIQQQYNKWMLAADREWTANGNPRAPGIEVYLGWITNAWESLTREAIQKSFKTCGITNNPDGSEDHLIHCLRPEGSIPLGQELLRKARLEKDIEVVIPEEPDEDEDLNNGYKSDENLAQ